MIAPTAADTATTATVSFATSSLLGQTILENSVFTPLKKPFFIITPFFCLKTDGIVVNDDYLVSLCIVCFLQNLQYFLVSIRSG